MSQTSPAALARLAQYRVIEPLGGGGMGLVFRAEDTQLQRPVALKIMRPEIAAAPRAKEWFLREARAMAAIKHDNVATIYQVDEHQGIPYLAMELLRGEPLDRWLDRGQTLKIPQIIRLGHDVAQGLAAAHRQGIVHRDIKPGNIWLEAPRGRPKILDFGLARSLADPTRLSDRGTFVGTPAYISPEQARDEPVDGRTDLYSLGVLLYRLLTGRLPFEADNAASLLVAILTRQPRPVGELNPEVPEKLAELVMRMLSKAPVDRPRRAEEVAELLRRIDRERKQGAAEGESIEPFPLLEVEDPPRLAKVKPSRAGRLRRRLLLVAAAVLLLVPALAASAWWLRPRTSPAWQVMLAELKLGGIHLPVAPIHAGEPLPVDFQLQRGGAAASMQVPEPPGAEMPRVELVALLESVRTESNAPKLGGLGALAPGERREVARPIRLRPSGIPPRGESRPFRIEGDTNFFPPGDYRLHLELRVENAAQDHQTLELTIREHPRTNTADQLAGLDGYQILRTTEGRGADVALRRGSSGDGGLAGGMGVTRDMHTGSDRASYVRFDLAPYRDRLQQLDEAVLLLTLQGGSTSSSKRTLEVYGVPDNVRGQDWPESGEGHLTWETAPGVANADQVLLGTVEIDNHDFHLNGVTDAIRLRSGALRRLLGEDTDGLISLFLRRPDASPAQTNFYTKEGDPERAPGLALKFTRSPRMRREP